MTSNRKIIALLLLWPLISSCTPKEACDYSAFYPEGSVSLKGAEIYCWKDKNDWFTTPMAILCGRRREPWEVRQSQESLSIPLEKMGEIVRMYDQRDRREWMDVTLVSYPPTEEQVYSSFDYTLKNLDTVNWLCEKLGMGWGFDSDGTRVAIPLMANLS